MAANPRGQSRWDSRSPTPTERGQANGDMCRREAGSANFDDSYRRSNRWQLDAASVNCLFLRKKRNKQFRLSSRVLFGGFFILKYASRVEIVGWNPFLQNKQLSVRTLVPAAINRWGHQALIPRGYPSGTMRFAVSPMSPAGMIWRRAACPLHFASGMLRECRQRATPAPLRTGTMSACPSGQSRWDCQYPAPIKRGQANGYMWGLEAPLANFDDPYRRSNQWRLEAALVSLLRRECT